MQIYLPIAEVSVNAWLLLGIGGIVGGLERLERPPAGDAGAGVVGHQELTEDEIMRAIRKATIANAIVIGGSGGIGERLMLDGYIRETGDKNVALLYNLINAVQSSKDSKTVITYEQDVIVEKENETQKQYYFVEVNPLISKENLLGYVVIFKDFTPVKKSMQQLQENQTRMMEQERLASISFRCMSTSVEF